MLGMLRKENTCSWGSGAHSRILNRNKRLNNTILLLPIPTVHLHFEDKVIEP